MADKTGIEWTDATWNPVRGCTRVSEGCRNCYAEKVAARFGKPGQPYEGLAQITPGGARWTGQVRLVEERLEDPLRWKKPRRIFVNSMSDLFHEGLSISQIELVWRVMLSAKHHTYQVLTKRAGRMDEALHAIYHRVFGSAYPTHISLPHWIHVGVSVEDQATAEARIPFLLNAPAAVRFVSYEPALGPVDFNPWLRISWQCSGCRRYFPSPWQKTCPACGREDYWSGSHLFNPPGRQTGPGLNWIICGGESGPGARPMHPDWARSVRDQCRAATTRDTSVAFFFKQHGEWVGPGHELFGRLPEGPLTWIDSAGRILNPPPQEENADCLTMKRVGKKAAGRTLDGRTWDQFPEVR